MIAVFDTGTTGRALSLRDTIRNEGYLCAAANAGQLKKLMPIRLIVTFMDQFDIIRRMPYDDIPVVVFGEGFVNRALNAVKANGIKELLLKIGQMLVRVYGLEQREVYPGGGIFIFPGVFLAAHQLIVYGSKVDYTATELMILKCLILSGEHYRSAEQIAAYCFEENLTEGNIRVHICNINRKAERILPNPLVVSRTGLGYRFGCAGSGV